MESISPKIVTQIGTRHCTSAVAMVGNQESSAMTFLHLLCKKLSHPKFLLIEATDVTTSINFRRTGGLC
jgi:hypothetical protein